jgi:hypothetical protein
VSHPDTKDNPERPPKLQSTHPRPTCLTRLTRPTGLTRSSSFPRFCAPSPECYILPTEYSAGDSGIPHQQKAIATGGRK